MATPLIGMLMFGNLLREAGVVDRLTNTAAERAGQHRHHLPGPHHRLHDGGARTSSRSQTLLIIVMGLVAFILDTAAGVLFGKLMMP